MALAADIVSLIRRKMQAALVLPAAVVDEYGIPIFGDEVDLIGHRLQKVYDYSYDTDAECDDRAVAQLRKHDAAKKRGGDGDAAQRGAATVRR